MLRWRVLVGAGIVVLLVAISLVLARVLLGPDMVLFGAFLFGFYLLFAGMPYWIPILLVEGDDVRERLQGEFEADRDRRVAGPERPAERGGGTRTVAAPRR